MTEICQEDNHQTMDLVSIRCTVLVISQCSMDLVAMGQTCLMALVLVPTQRRSAAALFTLYC